MATAFFKTYQRLCASIGKSDNAVAAEIGLSNSTVTSWRNGAVPRQPTIKKIAEYFDVSSDEVMGYPVVSKKEKPAPVPESGLSDRARAVGTAFERAKPELQKMIEAVLSDGERPGYGVEHIKITCPLDSREQVIEQLYYVFDGKKLPEKNNGCEQYRPCKECEDCRLKAMARILDLD